MTYGRPCMFYCSGVVLPEKPLPRSVDEHRQFLVNIHRSVTAFRVMCYNILADVYASSDYARKVLFSYVSDAKYITKDYRSQLVLKEILATRADIICLQEIERDQYNDYFRACLESPVCCNGTSYNSRYTNKNGGNQEGCAMFISTARFHIVLELDIPLGYAVCSDPAFSAFIRSNEHVADILGARVGTIAQITVLQDIHCPANIAIVSNSHYFYHPKANYVRLMHTKALLDIISEVKEIISGSTDLPFSSFITGLNNLKVYRPSFMSSDQFMCSTIATDNLIQFYPPIGCDSSFKADVGVIFMGDLNSKPGTEALQLIEK